MLARLAAGRRRAAVPASSLCCSLHPTERRTVFRKQYVTSPALACQPTRRNAWTCSAAHRPSPTLTSTCTTQPYCYSTVASPTVASEQVQVACRSHGHVNLSIWHPLNATTDDSVSPVILYIPTAPHASETWNVCDEKIIAALSAASNGTIVRPSYRPSHGLHYPTPVHDVLAAYDYVKDRYSPPPTTTKSGRVRKPHLRIGVCGQLVGGSLAAMLALTESRLLEDRVAAVALNSPIVDWIFPDTAAKNNAPVDSDQTDEALDRKLRHRRKKAARLTSWDAYGEADGLSTSSLHLTRDTLFKKPADYFDPFASPTLFFRSAGVNVPGNEHPDDEIIDGLTPPPSKPRKAHRNFPPSDSSLVLPSVRLSVGEANPLHDQDEEFVKLLRRSVVRTVENRASTQAMLDRFDETPATETERLELAIAAAEEKVEYHVNTGTGLWGTPDEHEWRDEVWEVARWFRRVLT